MIGEVFCYVALFQKRVDG